MLKRFLSGLILLAVCSLAPITVAHAYNPLDSACQTSGANNPQSSSACSGRTTTDPISGTNGILRRVTTLIALIAGVAAVIVIIIGGLQYILSGGDPQKAASARNMVLGAVVGLVIIAAAQGILLFILSRIS